MRTKIVFSVVSGTQNKYLSQAMVATYTARRYNPNAEILLVVDRGTEDVIKNKLHNIRQYVSNVVVVNTPDDMSDMHKSRFLKTTLRQNLEGDFLFIDTDTVVTCDLSSIDDLQCDVVAVIDRHSYIEEHVFRSMITQDIAPIGLTLEDLNSKYFNSGVMYVKETAIARRLFEKWHESWNFARKVSKGIDQPSLALANKQCGYPIQELNGIWNCQLSDNFINYLPDAKILHYFASNHRSPYLLSDKNILKEIFDLNNIPQWLKDAMERPKTFFNKKHYLTFGEDVHFIRTNVHVMYIYHRWLFNFFEFISNMATFNFSSK